MEKNRLEELRQGIFSQTLLIGGWKRRKAVTELAAAAKAQDRDAVLLLAEALKKSTDDQVKSIARDSLTSINEQKCINALCEAWHTDRSNELGQLLKKAGWVATTSDQLKLLTALKSGKLDHITNSGKEIVDQLFKATEDSDREIAENARTALGQLRNSTAHELLCKMVIEDDHKKAREIVLSAGYAPSDNHQKAVFYFLTQQWEKYDKLDSGQKLLRAAYEKADKKLKARLDEGAKANGRPIAKPEPQPPATVPSPAQPKPSQQKPTPPKPTPPAEPVKPKPVSQQPISSTVLAAAEKEPRKVYNLFDMTEKEWAMLIIALEENKQRAGIWHIAQEAPPKWSLHLLKWMKASGWVPRNEEKAEFDELTKLAQKCDFEALKAPIHAQATLEGHSDMVNCLAVTSDSRYLVSAGADKTAIVWDFAAGKLLHKLEGHSGAISCMTLTPDDRHLVTGSADGKVYIWSLIDGKATATLEGHTDEVSCVAISPDGKTLASGSLDNSIRLWSLPNGKILQELKEHSGSVWSLAFSPDGKQLASGGGLSDHSVRLWNVSDGKIQKVLEGHKGLVRCLLFTQDGSMIISGSGDNNLRFWDTKSGSELNTLKGHRGLVYSLAMPANSSFIASASVDNTARLWNIADGKEIKKLDRHKARLTSLVIDKEGRVLASGSWDNSIRLWSLPGGHELRALEGHSNWVTCLAIGNIDGEQILVSGSRDSTIKLWTLKPIVLSNLPARLTTDADLAWTQKMLKSNDLSDASRKSFEFIEALMRWRKAQAQKQPPKRIEVGEFDIEISVP